MGLFEGLKEGTSTSHVHTKIYVPGIILSKWGLINLKYQIIRQKSI